VLPKIFSRLATRNKSRAALRRAELRQETSAPADAGCAASDLSRLDALQLSSISRVAAPSGARQRMANRMRIRSGMNAKCKSHLHACVSREEDTKRLTREESKAVAGLSLTEAVKLVFAA
jgi:hypothetical protein